MNSSLNNWKDPSKNNWSFTRRKIVGIGQGVGSHQLAYAINLSDQNILNGRAEAKIRFLNREQGYAGGLICRANANWNFLASYLVSNPSQGLNAVVFGVCLRGTFAPIKAIKIPNRLEGDYYDFSLEFFSGNIDATVTSSSGKFNAHAVIGDLAFSGCVGLVKLYNTEVIFKDFSFEKLDDPFERVVKPMYKYDVFISHSSKDKLVVNKIAGDLRNKGVSYWIDSEQIQFGESISEQIDEGIRNSKHVLVCLSSNLGRSNWCRAEYSSILHKYFSGTTNKRVIPLKLDNCPDDDIPPLLYDIRRADYSNKKEFDDLIQYLKS